MRPAGSPAELIANGKATHAVIGVSVTDTQQNTSIQSTVGATISDGHRQRSGRRRRPGRSATS